MTQLPPGWAEATIDEINLYKSRNITPSDFPNEEFELYSVPIFPTGKPEYVKGSEVGSSKQEVLHDDVLLCKINPRINRVWCVAEKQKKRQIASSEWIAIRNELISSNYLRYALTREKFREILCSEVSGVGGSLTRAQPKKVATYKIPLAPLPEQIRIANKLDSLLAKVETAQTRLEKIPALLKRFRQAVLAAATSGELTREWRESSMQIKPQESEIHSVWVKKYKEEARVYRVAEIIATGNDLDELPETWLSTRLGIVCDVYVGATPSRKTNAYWGGEINWVSSSEVAFCHITDTKETITDLGLANTSTNVHPVGTVLLAMIGQGKTRGQAAILDIPACHNQNTAALRVQPEYLLSEYLYYFLWKQYEENRKVGGGNNQKALNKSTVQGLAFPLPPIEEQAEIVLRVESLFAMADTVEKQYQAAKSRLDKLTQAILAKAFRGELVPQDPNDEPAAELLKRILAGKQEKSFASR